MVLLALDLGARHGLSLPMPGMVVVAYLGGLRAGLASAALTLGYALLPAAAASPRAVAPDAVLLRSTLLIRFAFGVAIVVGLLKERAERQRRALQWTVVQLEDANGQLTRLTFVDSLTSIANRRHFDETLALAWSEAVRQGTPLALLLVDVDAFKAYNDGYGHPAGDAALRQVARVLAHHGEGSRALVARYGGEEFAMLLPSTAEAEAVAVVERLRLAVSDLPLMYHDARIDDRLTVSIGVTALRPTNQTEPSALVTAADAALYRAKRAGRNRVRPALVA